MTTVMDRSCYTPDAQGIVAACDLNPVYNDEWTKDLGAVWVYFEVINPHCVQTSQLLVKANWPIDVPAVSLLVSGDCRSAKACIVLSPAQRAALEQLGLLGHQPVDVLVIRRH